MRNREWIDDEESEMDTTGMNDLDHLKQFALNMSALHSERYFDLKVQAGGKEFKAIKHVLMSSSEIFKVMLSSPNSIEAQDNLIKIENTDA